MPPDEPIPVDPDILDLLPRFASNRRRELATAQGALEAGDLEQVRRLGHQLKGVGASYGFDGLSQIGALVEASAKDGDAIAARRALASLERYLGEARVIVEGRVAKLLDLAED